MPFLDSPGGPVPFPVSVGNFGSGRFIVKIDDYLNICISVISYGAREGA